jgi:ubiquinone/menaquinone biosynthesis C-methylase UbiE
MTTQRERVVDQFTRQAAPFRSSPGIRDGAALDLVVSMTSAGPLDSSLDVACGPGLLVCAFASVVRHATGIDVTPAMLNQAADEARSQRVSNVSWDLGDGAALPYPDGAFTIVTCRFAFHHLEDPLPVLREMKRVCAGGGRIAVIDSAPAAARADAFNAMERLRDPSHVRAMPLEELQALFSAAELPPPATATYRMNGELEGLLRRSFPNPGDDVRIRALFEASVEDDRIDMHSRRDGASIRYAFPVAMLVACC